MKIKRFVTEYANYRIDSLSKNGISKEAAEAIRKIDQAVRYCEQGMLTIDQTIQTINEAGRR